MEAVLPPLKVGDRVVRGPTWCWGDQDLDHTTGSKIGVVEGVLQSWDVPSTFSIKVCWANGTINRYRYGRCPKGGKIFEDLCLLPLKRNTLLDFL